MNWRVDLRPEIKRDIRKAVDWYDSQRHGLGREFVSAVIEVLKSLAENPYLNARRGQSQQVRWRLAERFPYRVFYQVKESEQSVLVVAVIHTARHDRHWRRRLG